ncbi:MAG TPA: hypothetical protein VGN17_16430 [Bryobacteraceae bacterium]|jgi:hypothetical protein
MAMFAIAGTVLSVWTALRWGPEWLVGAGGHTAGGIHWLGFSTGWIAAALFLLPAAALLAMAFRPAIEIHETHLRIGRQEIPWNHIRRLDQTGWNVPLAVYLTLLDESRILLLYPGDFDSSASLLRHLRRHARLALLDGVPYRQFWGEPPVSDLSASRRSVNLPAAVPPAASMPPAKSASGANLPSTNKPASTSKSAATNKPGQMAPPRYPLLRPEDEEEVERMFQRLKTVGHLERRDQDPK